MVDHKWKDWTPPLARVMGVGRQQKPTPCLVHMVAKLCTFGVFALGVSFVFLNCDDIRYDICMFVLNKQCELLKFVFDSVYVDLKYDDIYLIFTAGYVC